MRVMVALGVLLGVGTSCGQDAFVQSLEALREKAGVPALGGAVFTADAIVAKGVTGVRKRGDDEPVTLADKWHLGSCTKAMTGTLAAVSVERGELKWESTIGEVLGKKVRRIHDDFAGVTLERLLANRGGFPKSVEDGLWGELYGSEERGDRQRMTLMKGTLTEAPAGPAGEYIYSNTGITVAGVMVELAAKDRWEDLMEERLFVPLGMKAAGFGAPGKKGRTDEPLGHGRDGRPEEPGPRADNPAAIGPAGTVHCSVEDFARVGMAHLAKNPRVMKASSWEAVRAVKEDEDYAYGWGRTRSDGTPVLAHTGSNTLWHAKIWLLPEKGIGVVAVTNDGADRGNEAVNAVVDLGMEMHEEAGR